MENIYKVETNKAYIIEECPDVNLLRSLGFRKNAKVFKKHAFRFGGPVLLNLDSSEVAIGKDIAQKILVREAI